MAANETQDDSVIPETQFDPHQQPPPPPELPNHGPDRAAQKTPEPQKPQNSRQAEDETDAPATPPSPDMPSAYDWDDFERRFELALQDADEKEKAILREAEGLAQYFRAWASAASAHDDERAVKRLQTRKHYVNIREREMLEKQNHYEEVVRAFESALALLRG